MADTKRYYWLQLNRDFFKRHDVKIIKSMENGKDYLLFYLQLLVESIDHEGCLRFSDTIPYNDKMLSVVTDTNIDVVRSALKIFEELGLLTVLDDETIYMEQVNKMIGSASQDEHTRESTRLRVQKYREKQRLLEEKKTENRYSNVTCNGEIEKEKEINVFTNVNTSPCFEERNKDKKVEKPKCYEVLVAYNSICKSLPSARTLSDKRMRAIKARLNTYSFDDIKSIFQKAEDSDFLKGKNNRNWQADFDWLLCDGNAAKVFDGKYDNKKGGGSGGRSENQNTNEYAGIDIYNYK